MMNRHKIIRTYYNKNRLDYNLQFFAKEGPGGEKTELPTTKKLKDARNEGQVAKSTDLIAGASLLALFLSIKFLVQYLGNGFIGVFDKFYGTIHKVSVEDFTIATTQMLFSEGIIEIIKIVLPLFLIAFTVAFIVNVAQVKWVISNKPLMPKFNKFNPVSGFKKMFSKDKLVELIKEIFKIGAIAYLSYNTLKDNYDFIFILYDLSLEQAIKLIGEIVIDLGVDISLIFLIFGLADYLYQKFKFKNDMKMTKQEIKDEYKQSEGDPHIKGKIKAKMREVSQRRMMQQLPEADVIITNPTHFAAAIKYDKEIAEAPILIAKGADYVAHKIKEVAKEHKIEIVENKPLARMLYYNVEIGEEIPAELYQMTAEVLAYVYGLKNK